MQASINQLKEPRALSFDAPGYSISLRHYINRCALVAFFCRLKSSFQLVLGDYSAVVNMG